MANLRKAHVKRVFGFDKDGKLSGDFVDVLRMEKVPFNFRGLLGGKTNLLVNFKLKWNDDQNNPDPNIDAPDKDIQQENAIPGRTTEQIKIVQHNSTNDDPMKLWCIKKTKINWNGKDLGMQNLLVNYKFDNLPADDSGSDGNEPPAIRKVTVIKVLPNNLDKNKMTNDDGSSKIIDWQTYKQWLRAGDKGTDDETRLDVEVCDQFKSFFGVDERLGGLRGQGVNYKFSGSRELYRATNDGDALFDIGDQNSVDKDNKTSVIRTDPFQIIVNWGGGGFPDKFIPVSLWKYNPDATIVYPGFIVNGWTLVMKAETQDEFNHGYKQALAELNKDKYGDAGVIHESKASGLVAPPYFGFPGESNIFFDFGAVQTAAADGHNEQPFVGNNLTFMERWNYVGEFFSFYKGKAYVQAYFLKHP